MKIALVVPNMFLGGVSVFILRLGRHLLQHGHEVTVVLTGEPGEWWPRVREAGMQEICIPLMSSFNRLTHVRRVHEALKGFDVLILNTDDRYGPAALPELPQSIVIISIIHNDCSLAYECGCGNAQAMDAVVAVSPKVRENVVARIGDGIVSQICYGIPAPKHPPSVDRFPISANPKLIYAGRILQQQKGVFLLPQILAELNQAGVHASLDVVGDGDDLAELKQKIARAGVEDQVCYWGPLSSEEVGRKLQESHILLMPSYYEGFGLIAMEAQANGCVPVVSRLPGVTDWNLLHGRTGFLAECGNTKSFADGVLALVNDPERWQSMSEAGVSRIREEFSVEKMGDNYLSLIDRIRKQKTGKTNVPRPGAAWNPKLIGCTAPLPNYLCDKLGIL